VLESTERHSYSIPCFSSYETIAGESGTPPIQAKDGTFSEDNQSAGVKNTMRPKKTNTVQFIHITAGQGRNGLELYGLTGDGLVYKFHQGIDEGWIRLSPYELEFTENTESETQPGHT
jgi:hypothetical protein